MTFSIVQLVAVLILGSSSFLSGWMLRRIQAKSREGQLQRELLEIRGSIPSLETNVRNRDQRIATLFSELTEWKTKVPNLESSIRRKEVEVTAREAEIAAMRVEVDALKTKAATSPTPARPAELDALREALRVEQERGVALAAAVAERDLHLAAATLGMSMPAPTVVQMIDPGINWNEKVQALEADIAQRDFSIGELQSRLDAESVHRRTADIDGQGRESELERLRAEVSKWQARVPKLVATIKARDATVAAHAAEIAAHDASIAARDAVIAERESTIAARDSALVARDSDITKRGADMAQRDAEIAARLEQMNERDARIDTLAAVLAERDAALAQLEVDRSAAQAELERQRMANGAANTSLEQHQRELANLSSQLSTLTAHSDSLAAALDERARAVSALEQKNQMLAQEFDAASQQEAMKLSTALRLGREEIDNHRDTLSVVSAERDSHAARAAAIETELGALRRRHAELAASAAQKQHAHAAYAADRQSERATLEQRLTSIEAQWVAADSARASAESEREALEQRLAESSASVTVAAAQRTALEQQLAALQQQQSRATAEVEARFRSLQRELVQREEQLAFEVEQRARHEQDLASQQSAHAAAVQRIDELQQVQSALEARLADADAERAEFVQRIASLQAEQGAHEQTSDAAQHARTAEQAENAQLAEEFKEQTAELAELHEEVRSLHTRVAPLESLLKQRDGALSERAVRIEALSTQLQALTTQNESLQSTLRQRGERIATLERKFSDQPPAPSPEPLDRRGEHLEQRLVAQIEKNRELTRAVEERERDVALAIKKNDLNEKSMLVLKQQLDDARSAQERLAEQLRELKGAAQRSPEPDPAADKMPMAQPKGLFELPPERIDELQQIRGIGAGFERGLNKLGIYQFSQLAGLGAEEIAWIEAHLPTFHGRVERDDWPGQAAALIASSEHAEWSLRAQVDDASRAPRVN